MTAPATTLLRAPLAIAAIFICLGAAPGHAERWQEHRAAALRAIEEVDYAKAIEQLEAAIYYARALPADDRDLSDLWENLTATCLADQQYRRAWDSIARWDSILVANADRAWAAAQQTRRDQMTRILFEATRSERGETAGEVALLSDLAPAGESGPIPRSATVQAPGEVAAVPTQNGAPQAGAAREVVPASAATQVEHTTPAELAPAAVNGTGGYGIHLASYGSDASARSGWDALQALYPDLLTGKRYTLRSVDLGDRGVFVRLIAVPFADSAAAGAACADLQRRTQYCVVLRTN